MLMIAGVAVSVFIAWLMVRLRLLDRIAARLQGWRWAFSTLAIGFLFFVVSDVLRLPWTLFADWHILRAFALSSQPPGDFLRTAALSSVVSGVFGALFISATSALIRRTGQ